MRYLNNFERINEFLDIDKKTINELQGPQKTIGVYAVVGSSILTGLYVHENKEYLFVDDKTYLIDSNFQANVEAISTEKKSFKLFSGEHVIDNFYYITDSHFQVSPFEYIDAEEYDWGLFLTNRINMEDKRLNFIKAKS